jgi:hypothetical protein
MAPGFAAARTPPAIQVLGVACRVRRCPTAKAGPRIRTAGQARQVADLAEHRRTRCRPGRILGSGVSPTVWRLATLAGCRSSKQHAGSPAHLRTDVRAALLRPGPAHVVFTVQDGARTVDLDSNFRPEPTLQKSPSDGDGGSRSGVTEHSVLSPLNVNLTRSHEGTKSTERAFQILRRTS